MDFSLTAQVETERRNDVVLLHLLGEHDLAPVGALQEHFDRSEGLKAL